MSEGLRAERLRTWRARNWKELEAIAAELIPELDPTSEVVERRFRGELLTPQEAGTVFERWIMEAFRVGGATGMYGYTVSMPTGRQVKEQIDGLVADGWQGFLVESKCLSEPVDFGPIALLNALVEKRVIGTLGLFFSISGYTTPALESTQDYRPIRVLLFDLEDLRWLVARKRKDRMMELVRRKWLLAVREGNPTLPVSRFTGFWE